MQTGVGNCPNCHATFSRADRFCAQCGSFIGIRCPSCEATLAAGTTFCGACGITLGVPQTRPIDSVAPQCVGGERKHVTMLFADMVGSTNLLSAIGSERGRWLIEAVVDRMKAAVEAFGGIVNQVSGDGIMALFGAPRALEDHALRACHAALLMQEMIGAESCPEVLDTPLCIRVGLHSGDVVVAERGRGFDHQYTAFGMAAHMAARMEQTAKAGQVLISASTCAQVAGRVEVQRLGSFLVKGIAEPVEIFVLTRVLGGSAARANRGFGASFIGRDAALALLGSLATAARDGNGHVAVVVGEPGSGKSRLCRELLGREASDFHVLQTGGLSFLPQPPYASAVHILRACLPVGASTEAEICAWLEVVSPEAPLHARALLPLLALGGRADPAWATLSYQQRQARTEAAIIHVLRRAAMGRPVLVFIDDLQWIDDATCGVIVGLARQIADSRILVLANARTGGVPPGLRDVKPMMIALDTFSEEETHRFLDAVLSPGPVSREAKRRLFRLTGGNAFFLEEVAKALHGGDVAGDEQPDMEIPGTVQDLVTMRIDCLPARSKAALQAAAVLGVELDSVHLARVLGLRPAEMADIAATLREAAFLLPARGDGAERLEFRHGLARDAAYAGLLQENQQHLHARALDVLEAVGAQEPSVLAFHARHCLNWTKAYAYSEAAGRVSIDRAAPREALRFLNDALDSLGRIPADDETRRAELILRFLIRNTLFSLGRAREIGEHLLAARRLAEALGDEAGQARALCQSAHYAWQMGCWTEAIAASETALTLSAAIGDIGLQASSIFFMGLANHALGRFKAGADLLARNVALLPGELAHERFGFVSICSVVSGSYLAICLTELGRFEEAERAATLAREIALKAGGAFDRIQAELALAGVALMQGKATHRIELLEEALSLCQAAAIAVLLPRTTSALALAYALSGRFDQASALATERDEQCGEAVRAMSLLASAEALLLCGDTTAAMARAETLIGFARTTTQVGPEAWGLLVLASGYLAEGAWQEAAGAAAASRAAALGQEMRPLAARAALVSALAAVELSRVPAKCLEGNHLYAAVRECKASGMGAWVPHDGAASYVHGQSCDAQRC
jgi:class 3 adenylate cyclase/tetratricopeptide (TPR) repeat protein